MNLDLTIKEKSDIVKYKGMWENSVRCGIGTAYNVLGFMEYKGEWRDNKYHGRGVKYILHKGGSNDISDWHSIPRHSGMFYRGNLNGVCRRYYDSNGRLNVEAC